jgi:hypothetical protein
MEDTKQYCDGLGLCLKKLGQPAWHPIETAPHDHPVLVWYDQAADPYDLRAGLTPYAVHAESGLFLKGSGRTIAQWHDAYEESNGWESGQSWTMPGAWFEQSNGDNSEYVCNALYWMEIPEGPVIK